MLCKRSVVFVLASSSLVALASSQPCTIADFRDIQYVKTCSEITIKAFTMPPGQPLVLSVQRGTKITQVGTITFAYGGPWTGAMMRLYGDQITYDGGGHTLECNGQMYWDGKGSAGKAKPGPAVSFLGTGTFGNLIIHNTPLNAVVVEAPGKTLLTRIFVDNGDGARLGGHNTDGFNVVQNTYDLTISDCRVDNQDDCIAVTSGTRITISNNKCSGGHGISLGSIKSHEHVSNVMIEGNEVDNSVQAFRIKTVSGAIGGSVDNIYFKGNTGTGLTSYGVIISQDYTEKRLLGPSGATNGIKISNVNFIDPPTILSVVGQAERVHVVCGVGSCFGSWKWGGLKFTGGGTFGTVIRAPITVGGFTEFSS